MAWKYTLAEPVLGEAELAAVADCIKSGWLSMGPRTQAFEARFAELTGAKHAIAVANGTAALHLALNVFGIGNSGRDEVIQPSINFVAAANMTCNLGAVPVFADIVAADEPTIDPDEVERLITEKTRAVVAMHYGGYPARLKRLADICKQHAVPLIEDACHAPLQPYAAMENRHLGTLGDIGCFSFFSNKNMTTAEGGMLVTENDELAEQLRRRRSHGMTSLSWDRHHGRPSSYDVEMHGYNYRIDDLRAALGLAQLERLPEINRRRRALAQRYAEAIDAVNTTSIRYIFAGEITAGTAHIAGIVVEPDKRDRIRLALADAGIQTSLHYPPIHHFTAFAGKHGACLPRSEAFAASMITLPMHPGLPDTAPGEIISMIADLASSDAA